MRRYIDLLLITLLILALAGAALGVVHVKADSPAPIPDGNSWQTAYRSIQAAVDDAAASGEDVWVARGTYAEKVVAGAPVNLYGGFAGTETDLNARDWLANPTVIDAGGAGIGVRLAADARIDGFAIDNAEYGVYCDSCSPTVANNTVTRCGAFGIYCLGGSVTMNGNTVSQCNYGVGCELGSTSIMNSVFSNNAEYAVYCLSGSHVVTANTMQSNYGGIYASSGSMKARRNRIYGSASCGIYCCENVVATISGNVVAGNGEGVRVDEISAAITNNTILSNGRFGVFWHNGAPAVANNIVGFNATGLAEFGGAETLSRNDVYQNGVAYGDGIAHLTDISADPLFVDFTTGDYHLTPGSPCVNAGDGAALGILAQDMDGEARVQGSAVDIGADELAGAAKIQTARSWGANMPAGLEDVVVTAWFGDYFYVETKDRTCGMRVEKMGEPSHLGWRVRVVGTIKLNADGEMYVDASSVADVEPDTVRPIAFRNADLGGGSLGLQEGVWNWQWNRDETADWNYEWTPSRRLGNIGLLVTTSGRVTSIGEGYVYIDDGSRLDDGTLTGARRNIGVRVMCDPAPYAVGESLMVTGVSSCFRTTAGLARRLLPVVDGIRAAVD